MQPNIQDITDHFCWPTLDQEQKNFLLKGMESKWDGLMHWWCNHEEWPEREEQLRDQQLYNLEESNLNTLIAWLQDADDDLDEALFSQLVEHLQDPDYYEINGQWEQQVNLSWAQIEMVKSNGNTTDRLQGWIYFYAEITESYLREHGFADWLDQYLDEQVDEISDDDRTNFLSLIEENIFQRGHAYVYQGDPKAGNKLVIKCIETALENKSDDDFTVEEEKGLVATMAKVKQVLNRID